MFDFEGFFWLIFVKNTKKYCGQSHLTLIKLILIQLKPIFSMSVIWEITFKNAQSQSSGILL